MVRSVQNMESPPFEPNQQLIVSWHIVIRVAQLAVDSWLHRGCYIHKPRLRHCPVIALTAGAAEEAAKEALGVPHRLSLEDAGGGPKTLGGVAE